MFFSFSQRGGLEVGFRVPQKLVRNGYNSVCVPNTSKKGEVNAQRVRRVYSTVREEDTFQVHVQTGNSINNTGTQDGRERLRYSSSEKDKLKGREENSAKFRRREDVFMYSKRVEKAVQFRSSSTWMMRL
jgi:hypothetical protein